MIVKTRLIFVRHAEAEGNHSRIFHGFTDSEITEKGHIQAKRLAERFKDIDVDVLYSSSLKRTLQTAKYISDVKKLAILRTDKLKEINGGDWEGQYWHELSEKWPDEYDTWEHNPGVHKMPNGESMSEFQKRLVDEVINIINNNKGKNICIVTHGTAIRALMCYFYGHNIEKMIDITWHDNTSITIVSYDDDKFIIEVEGDTIHLDAGLSTIKNQEWWIEHKEKMRGRI